MRGLAAPRRTACSRTYHVDRSVRLWGALRPRGGRQTEAVGLGNELGRGLDRERGGWAGSSKNAPAGKAVPKRCRSSFNGCSLGDPADQLKSGLGSGQPPSAPLPTPDHPWRPSGAPTQPSAKNGQLACWVWRCPARRTTRTTCPRVAAALAAAAAAAAPPASSSRGSGQQMRRTCPWPSDASRCSGGSQGQAARRHRHSRRQQAQHTQQREQQRQRLSLQQRRQRQLARQSTFQRRCSLTSFASPATHQREEPSPPLPQVRAGAPATRVLPRCKPRHSAMRGNVLHCWQPPSVLLPTMSAVAAIP